MPRGARLVVIGLTVAAGFVAVVLPLFSSGGLPRAEIAGALPDSVSSGQTVRIDIAVNNTGDTSIYPVCVALESGPGATLVSANFQGLDDVTATADKACGGSLTSQETISVTLRVTFAQRGSVTLKLVPLQGTTVIGPAFTATVGVA
jgi:hypothetical protein